jgi:hypothetical protein
MILRWMVGAMSEAANDVKAKLRVAAFVFRSQQLGGRRARSLLLPPLDSP